MKDLIPFMDIIIGVEDPEKQLVPNIKTMTDFTDFLKTKQN